jgi:hypothetical protein
VDPREISKWSPRRLRPWRSTRGRRRGWLACCSTGPHRAAQLIAQPSGCGNIIDGPALSWLATQDQPRVWISDGHVTGAHEVQHPALVAEALRIQLAGHITRLDDLPSAITFFGALRRHAA